MPAFLPVISPGELQGYLTNFEIPARRTAGWAEAELILRRGAFVGSAVEVHGNIERTMDLARRHIDRWEEQDRSVASGTVFLAESLNGSRGRFARRWHAPRGGLWGSMILVNNLLPEAKLLLPLAFGVAGCEAVREVAGGVGVIRWINDILVEGRKAAGFLLEGYFGNSGEEYLLAGFGFNLNNSSFPPELSQTAISLSQALGRRIDAACFFRIFLAKLSWNLGLLYHEEALALERGDQPLRLPGLIGRYRELCDTPGREVVYGFDVLAEPQYRARALAIEPDGGLRLRGADGSEIIEHSGEVRYLSTA